MIKIMLIAGCGGFLGSCMRFLVGRAMHALCASPFPWGTLTVNIVGSFIIGILFGLAERTNMISPAMNAFLITGFCGGFTTFSTLADDMYLMVEGRQWLWLGGYVCISFMLGLLLVWAGRAVARLL